MNDLKNTLLFRTFNLSFPGRKHVPGVRAWFSLIGLFRKKSHDAEMAEEIRQHLDGLIERNVTAGMSPEEARCAALRQFGGVEQIKEIAREQRVWMWAEQLWQDLAFACRVLWKSPAFSGANYVSSESARSRGRRRRGANDGAAWHCSVCHSGPASACRRSIQTHAL